MRCCPERCGQARPLTLKRPVYANSDILRNAQTYLGLCLGGTHSAQRAIWAATGCPDPSCNESPTREWHALEQARCLSRRAYVRPTYRHALRVIVSWSASDLRWSFVQPLMPESKDSARLKVRLGLTLEFFSQLPINCLCLAAKAHASVSSRKRAARFCRACSYRPTSRHALRVIDSWSASDSRWNLPSRLCLNRKILPSPRKRTAPAAGLILCPRLDMRPRVDMPCMS